MERSAIYSKYKDINGESNDWDFNGEETQRHMHTIHPYPAKMIPQIPDKAMMMWSKEGETILDPFSGCGTTLLEAIINKRNAIGIDNNPVACLITECKIKKYTEDEIKEIKNYYDAFDNIINSKELIPRIPIYKNMEYWFAKEAIQELGTIKASMDCLSDDVRKIALCCLSAIIVRISYQESDTKYSRKEYEYIEKTAIKAFKSKLRAVIDSIEEINEEKTGKAVIIHGDGRENSGIENESVDLIVTSPPYLNAYDYHKYHRHRMQWIDGNVEFARDNEIGKHDTFTRKGATPEKYFKDMNACFCEWKRVMKKQAKCVIVVGDAIVNGKPVAVGDEFVEMLEELELKCIQRSIRNLDVNKKSFNQKSRINKEHVLVFEKQ